MEHEAAAVLAAQGIRIASRIEERNPVAVGLLGDGKAGRGVDFADQAHHLVALDQLLRLGDRGLRIDAVLGNQLDLPAEYAAGRIGFLNRERSGLESVFPQLSEKPGARCDVAQFDGVGLRAHYGREAELRGDRSGAQGRALLEYFATGVGAVVLAVFHLRSPLVGGWRLACGQCERVCDESVFWYVGKLYAGAGKLEPSAITGDRCGIGNMRSTRSTSAILPAWC